MTVVALTRLLFRAAKSAVGAVIGCAWMVKLHFSKILDSDEDQP